MKLASAKSSCPFLLFALWSVPMSKNYKPNLPYLTFCRTACSIRFSLSNFSFPWSLLLWVSLSASHSSSTLVLPLIVIALFSFAAQPSMTVSKFAITLLRHKDCSTRQGNHDKVLTLRTIHNVVDPPFLIMMNFYTCPFFGCLFCDS